MGVPRKLQGRPSSYQHFFADESEQIALRAYFGQAYKCLDAASLGDEDLSFAQSHLHITSFLYGLLRPLDGIRPYRMEGRLSFDATGGLPLFDYWKPRLTRVLIDAVKAETTVFSYIWPPRKWNGSSTGAK